MWNIEKECNSYKPDTSCLVKLHVYVRIMVFNATYNNTSVISWRSDLLVEETGILGENHDIPQATDNFLT